MIYFFITVVIDEIQRMLQMQASNISEKPNWSRIGYESIEPLPFL